MKDKKKLIVGGVAAVLVLWAVFGCGGGMPSCDDGEVKKQVVKELQRFFETDENFELMDIVTESINKDTQFVSCKAKTDKSRNLGFGMRMPIDPSYTAQRTSDGKLIVKVDWGF